MVPIAGWAAATFRGYADHMESQEFAEGFAELLRFASSARTTLMCAEAVWWRCHRALIADALKLRGVKVIHILDATHSIEHPYTSPARIVRGRLVYSKRSEE